MEDRVWLTPDKVASAWTDSDMEALARPSILLVEDDADTRALMVTLLEIAGFTPRACATAEEGLERLREQQFDLVLTDYMLPHRSGAWLLRQASEEGLLDATPALVVTAHPSPRDTDGFLKLCKGLKEKGTPPGFALGNATGDGNTWCQWIVWAHGGKLVDANNKVVIDSPETIKALEYVKELYSTFAPGTLSWLDPNNNKAFLDEQISLTNNGISIYYAAKTSKNCSRVKGSGIVTA